MWWHVAPAWKIEDGLEVSLATALTLITPLFDCGAPGQVVRTLTIWICPAADAGDARWQCIRSHWRLTCRTLCDCVHHTTTGHVDLGRVACPIELGHALIEHVQTAINFDIGLFISLELLFQHLLLRQFACFNAFQINFKRRSQLMSSQGNGQISINCAQCNAKWIRMESVLIVRIAIATIFDCFNMIGMRRICPDAILVH